MLVHISDLGTKKNTGMSINFFFVSKLDVIKVVYVNESTPNPCHLFVLGDSVPY